MQIVTDRLRVFEIMPFQQWGGPGRVPAVPRKHIVNKPQSYLRVVYRVNQRAKKCTHARI